MNKQQFLAELKRLLTYMMPEDRSAVLAHYGERFDRAGEAGQAALLAELGSPTKTAIALSRGYSPGDWAQKAPEPTRDTAEKPAEAPAEDDPAPPAGAEVSFEPEAPAEDADCVPVPAETAETAEAEAAPEALSEDAPESEDVPTEAESVPVPSVPEEPLPSEDKLEQIQSAIQEQMQSEAAVSVQPETGAEEIPQILVESESVRLSEKQPEPPAAAVSNPLSPAPEAPEAAPSGGRKLLSVLLAIVPGIPALVLVLAAACALLLPGAAVIAGAVLVAIGGLWAAPILMDALLFFGAALALLAVGILLLWLGIWVDIKLFALFFRLFGQLRRKVLGLRAVEPAPLPACGGAWKVFLWVCFVLFVLGLALLAVAMFSGGSISAIRSHGNLDGYVEALRINWASFRAFFGIH